MLRCIFAVVLAMAVSVDLQSCAWAENFSTDPGQVPSGSYRMDTAHSQVLFSIVHLGMTNYYGRFDRLSGTLKFDSGQPEKSSVSVAIETASIDTPSERLNDELKSTIVFAADRFPSASFESVSIVRTGYNTGRITGNLTIKGVTKPVTLDTVFTGSGNDLVSGAYAIGFHASTTIKRSDFGLTGAIWDSLVSDDVKLIIEAMFEHEKE
ncbi:MAG: YceI family protein [Rhizomicrobium sp.]